MKFRSACFALTLSAALLAAGCATTPTAQRVDTGADAVPTTMGLDYRDFELAAVDAVNKMLGSGVVDHPDGGRYVLAISRIVNDTMQRIDTDQLTKKIRVELLNSGRVVTTTAIGLDGAEDEMTMAVRELRQSDEVNQDTVAAKGQIISPDYSLSGKIIQRNQSLDKRTQRAEYYLQLSLTDINTGLAFWEGETMIIKQGSNRSAAW